MKEAHWWGIFALIFVISLFPLVIRAVTGQPILMSNEPYFFLRMGEIDFNGIIGWDESIVGGKPISFSPIFWIFSLISDSTALIIISMVLSAFSFMLLERVFDRFLPENKKWFALLVFISSPIFLTLAKIPSDKTFLSFFLLLGSYFLFKEDFMSLTWALLCFIIVSFSGFHHVLMILAIAFAYAAVAKQYLRGGIVAVTVIITASVAIFPRWYYYGVQNLHSSNIIHYMITDFGSNFGMSIFSMALAAAGMFLLWGKKRYYLLKLMFPLLLIASIWSEDLLIYTNVCISILAAIAIEWIAFSKWKLKTVQQMTFILVGCGLLFSAVSFSERMIDFPPSSDQYDALRLLAIEDPGRGNVIAPEDQSIFIQTLAKKRVYYDWLEGYVDDNPTTEILGSFNLDTTRHLLQEYDIRYVIIPSIAYESGWIQKERGLNLLLHNSETFKKLFQNKYGTIWQVRIK